MSRRALLTVCCIVLLLVGSVYGATRVEKVRFEQRGEKVHIFYDLVGTSEKYMVSIKVSSDGGRSFDISPKALSGDVGEAISPGAGKEIVWDALKDVGELSGEAFVFAVTVWVAGVSGREIVVRLAGGANMEMVWIEPGTFRMGSPSSESGRSSDEGPQHKVTITQGFYLGKYEITQEQWKSVMGTTPWSGKDYVQTDANHPAVYISWNDMQEFIKILGLETTFALRRG